MKIVHCAIRKNSGVYRSKTTTRILYMLFQILFHKVNALTARQRHPAPVSAGGDMMAWIIALAMSTWQVFCQSLSKFQAVANKCKHTLRSHVRCFLFFCIFLCNPSVPRPGDCTVESLPACQEDRISCFFFSLVTSKQAAWEKHQKSKPHL